MPDSAGPIVRRLFSFPVMLAASLPALAVLTVRSRFNDPDLWWHLRTGQIIWTERAIPRIDLLSFTTGQHSWVPHEWLSQLSMYAAWRAGDYSGLMLWFCIADRGASGDPICVLLALFRQREGRLPGSAGHLVLRYRGPGDPAPNVGIHLPRLRASDPAPRPLARSPLVLPAASPVRAVGELARIVFPRDDRAGDRAAVADSSMLSAGLLASRPLDRAQRQDSTLGRGALGGGTIRESGWMGTAGVSAAHPLRPANAARCGDGVAEAFL